MIQVSDSPEITSQNNPQPASASGGGVNVGSTERMVSAVAGGALALLGLRARSIWGLAAAAVGGALIYRGVSGHCACYAALGVDTSRDEGAAPKEYFERAIQVEESITVNRSPWDL